MKSFPTQWIKIKIWIQRNLNILSQFVEMIFVKDLCESLPNDNTY